MPDRIGSELLDSGKSPPQRRDRVDVARLRDRAGLVWQCNGRHRLDHCGVDGEGYRTYCLVEVDVARARPPRE